MLKKKKLMKRKLRIIEQKFLKKLKFIGIFLIRMAFSLGAASLQHVMIDSESLYFQNGMPIPGFEQLKIIKDSSLVISPDEILTHVMFSMH